MKTLTTEQRIEGFTELEGVIGEGGVGGAHLMSFLAGIAHAEKILGEVKQDDEPVGTIDHNGNFELLRMVGVSVGQPIKLYPEPKVPFVRLTDEEKNVLFNRVVMEGLTMMQFVDAVENQLVEKNT